MSNLKIEQLTFGYDLQNQVLFDHVSLNLDTSWKLGLVGRNGRGKSTLLNIFQNKLSYQGTISCQKEMLYFPMSIANEDLLTFDIIQDLTESELWQVERELKQLSVDDLCLWRPFSQLSGGEQTKILLAVLFAAEDKFLLIDEPTNHLDAESRKLVAEYFSSKKQGFIVVSHDKQFLNNVVDHILAIERCQLKLYQGNYQVYEQEKFAQDQVEQLTNQKLTKEIKRLGETAKEKESWAKKREQNNFGRNIAERMMRRSKAIEHRMDKQIDEKKQLLRNVDEFDSLTAKNLTSHHQVLLRFENFSLKYKDSDTYLFQPINAEIKGNEQWILSGLNGVGKSTLIDFINQPESYDYQGDFFLADKVQFSHISQNYNKHRGTLKEFAEVNQLDYTDLLNLLRKLGVERDVFRVPIEEMSMGQRKKVEVVKSLLTPAHLFIWDEPLNYLDTYNQQQLLELIAVCQLTVLCIEHDLSFQEQFKENRIVLKSPLQKNEEGTS
ncbi:ribosomal protection-like ABC-F family protein [Vagococcus vulneris]|uniref:ABC transporter domain-containing protein n=1 Tax=Vagococcus vulneris TaxID=1977869 RepID=A0A430A137_9ENTE|nr:ATP-binding cassette domain-containing protein [Vagococcus vulneris]RSU00093.1 hypothetical protein CBF37_01980 [Vagococcus vulneris]